MHSQKILYTGFLLLLSLLGQAQILDDSTKQVYGPTTTRFLFEKDLLSDREAYHFVDTTIDRFHNYDFLSRNNYRYVDLGNLGTATRPVFYAPPAEIGVYSGFNAYNPYFYYPDDVRYYDTKSPYSSLYYVQGGLLQQLLKVDFSRNITPRWNAGFNYLRPTSPMQFAYENREQDRAVDGHSFVFFTRYESPDSAYHVLAHLSHLNHTSNDLGGLLPGDGAVDSSGLNYDVLLEDFRTDADAQIPRTARSIDLRLNYHLYHQYKFAQGFQVYHVFDRQVQQYRFVDTDPRNADTQRDLGRPFYPNYYLNDTITNERTRFAVLENKVGLKGILSGWNYRVYARRRDWVGTFQADSSTATSRNPKPRARDRRQAGETFLGLWTQYQFNPKFRLRAEGELMLFRDYRLNGTIETPWFTGGYNSVVYSPTLIQQRSLGNHTNWDYSDRDNGGFRNTRADQLFGTIILKSGTLTFMPSLTITNLDNYIFFDEQSTPQQVTTPIQLVYAGASLDYRWKVLRTQHEAIYTLRSGPSADVIRIPAFFVTSRLFAEGPLFKKALYMQLGVEMHYKSNYKGDAYMPAIGQFHLQHEFVLRAYPLFEVFANARINRVRLFAKFAHVNQGLVYGNGYFISPYFPGQSRTLAFGANWLLFD